MPESFETYQIVNPGDIVMRLTDLQNDKRSLRQGLVNEKGIISSAYDSIYPVKGHDSRYWAYALLAMDLAKYYYSLGGGVRQSIKFKDFPNDWIYTPLEKNQKEIADFLDRETECIDQLIEKKESLLNAVSEKKSSVITTAVTKGLDPNRKFKESGIDWLGKIPENWMITKLKFIGKAIIGLTYAPEDIVEEGNGTLVLRSANIQQGEISFKNNVYVNKDIPIKLVTRPGDILICSRNGSRALIGKNALITQETSGHSFGAFTTVFRTKYFEFIYYVMNSELFNYQSGLFLTSTINQLTTGTLNNFEIPLPPKNEQKEIVNHINDKTKPLDSLQKKIKKSIEYLHDIRVSLITEAVTGQLNIQKWRERRMSDQCLDKIEEDMKQSKKASA
ncbi:restriction endonuclease subunit S [Legionella pneumophila]|uniref:restriction endonuclease subunit S n=1 Tax=Legionella pneumophila TaxID=446 RepID=UPI0010AAD0A6|nr:restriction endonuclease subunit S [Legionella pneumophila]TIG84043.1 restriction endonuclease subunit S [Legionella pneumophila]HAT8773714.1 restriction endonuclease subunit S [Legionella pneumophila]HAU2192748.1 restriction endonuclease subunit S [Legionella pneumophila]